MVASHVHLSRFHLAARPLQSCVAGRHTRAARKVGLPVRAQLITGLPNNTEVPSLVVGAPPPVLPAVDVSDENDLSKLVDVQEPYCRLQAVRVGADGSVTCVAIRESLRHGEANTPMAAWEILRHAAVAGEFACAAVNPVKARQYYLGMSATHQLEAYAGGAQLPPVDLGDDAVHAVELKASVVTFSRGFATAEIQVFTPDRDCPVRHQLYATVKVRYAVLNETQFRKKFQGLFLSPERAAELHQEGMDLPSPYLDVVSMSTKRAPAKDTRTARLCFDHPLMAAGHFPNLPMLPASMGLGNMTHAVSLFGNGRGGLLRFTTLKYTLKIYGMAMVNEEVTVRAVRESDTMYSLTLLNAAGAPILAVPKFEIVPLP